MRNLRSNHAVSIPAQEGLSQYETNRIAYFLSNKAMLIPNLLSYFQTYPEKFVDRDFQLLFYYALFSRNVIEDSIKNNPLWAVKLREFLLLQLDQQKGLGNIQEQLFFLRMIQELSELIPSFHAGVNIQKQLRSLVNSVQDKTLAGKRIKALAYLHLLASYHDKDLSEKEVSELAAAYTYVKAFGYDPYLSHPFIEKDMIKTLEKVTLAVQKSSSYQKNFR